jgi:hypothetical protein
MTDFDSPWKEALEVYFRAFLALFFPLIHEDIDWSRGFEFLDKELQKIVRTSASGRLYVDKLVKVWRKNGREAWVLIHIEVQTQRERNFARRMYGYNTRISDRYNRTVVSLAVLADDDPSWRPDRYGKGLWGWSVQMRWPPVKLLDYADRADELEASTNPFAKVVLAHLKALETRKDMAGRRNWKTRLIQGLYERGFSSEDIRQLFRVIDWLMELPRRMQRAFEHELDVLAEERRMPYVTSIERTGMLKVIERSLRTKFGEKGVELVPAIEELNDAEKYLVVNDAIITATTLDEVRRACAQAAAPARRTRKGGNGKRGTSKTDTTGI